VKVLMVGDDECDKNVLIMRSWVADGPLAGEQPWDCDYQPTTNNNFVISLPCGGSGQTVELELWDTQGQVAFEQLRRLSYPGTDIFLLVFNGKLPESLDNVRCKWMPEVEESDVDDAWTVIVGCKMGERVGADSDVPVAAAHEVCKEINACGYVSVTARATDFKQTGLGALGNLVKKLALMKTNGEPRPNWGELQMPGYYESEAQKDEDNLARKRGGAMAEAEADIKRQKATEEVKMWQLQQQAKADAEARQTEAQKALAAAMVPVEAPKNTFMEDYWETMPHWVEAHLQPWPTTADHLHGAYWHPGQHRGEHYTHLPSPARLCTWSPKPQPIAPAPYLKESVIADPAYRDGYVCTRHIAAPRYHPKQRPNFSGHPHSARRPVL